MMLISIALATSAVAAPTTTLMRDWPAAEYRPSRRSSCQSGKRASSGRRSRLSAHDGSAGDSVHYANCTAARAAGAAPVMRGDPGYSRKLDRDNDGVGCE